MTDFKEDTLSTKTLDDEFHRKKTYLNACKFDDATLRRRDLEMKELQKAYPHVCKSWLELAWNFTEYTPKEEQDRIIATKCWEVPPTNKRNTGGVLHNSMSIMTREEDEKQKLEAELKKKLDLEDK
tara:strand:+ start:372 stop:749 length:378 start_codon:yes stop_codon:yes gene_type:complete